MEQKLRTVFAIEQVDGLKISNEVELSVKEVKDDDADGAGKSKEKPKKRHNDVSFLEFQELMRL